MTQPFASMGTSFFNAYIAYNQATRWSSFVDNADCVRSVINNDYWTAMANANPSSGSSFYTWLIIILAIAGAIIIIAVIVIIMRCKKSSSTDEDQDTSPKENV